MMGSTRWRGRGSEKPTALWRCPDHETSRGLYFRIVDTMCRQDTEAVQHTTMVSWRLGDRLGESHDGTSDPLNH